MPVHYVFTGFLGSVFPVAILMLFKDTDSRRSVNISNANIFGLSKELNLVQGNKFNNALVIFFVPYVLFEIPSNMLLKKFQPRVWRKPPSLSKPQLLTALVSACMFFFGLISICQGLVRSYSGLLTIRMCVVLLIERP